jgi:hypothetical protein
MQVNVRDWIRTWKNDGSPAMKVKPWVTTRRLNSMPLERISARIVAFSPLPKTLHIAWCWHGTLKSSKGILDVVIKMVEAADCILKVLAMIDQWI